MTLRAGCVRLAIVRSRCRRRSLVARPRAAAELRTPPNLPRYDLDITLDTATHHADDPRARHLDEHDAHRRPIELVFNFYPHYRVPAGDALLLAKTLELLRLQPSLGIDRDGQHRRRQRAPGSSPRRRAADVPLTLRVRAEEPDRAAVPAARSRSQPGESVTVELICDVRLPNKQGRWGHWEGVTFLTNALPLLAFYDDTGWQPTPFVPWHQPFFNEAGVFTRHVTLPADEKVACPAVVEVRNAARPTAGSASRREPFVGRDFAVLCSAATRSSAASTTLPDGRDGRAHAASPSPSTSSTPTEILQDRRRGDPGLLAVVRRRSRTRSSPSPSRSSAGTATSAPASS